MGSGPLGESWWVSAPWAWRCNLRRRAPAFRAPSVSLRETPSPASPEKEDLRPSAPRLLLLLARGGAGERLIEAPAKRRVGLRGMRGIGGGGGHAPHQVVVVFVAIGFQIEVRGQHGQALVAHPLDVGLHEPVVGAPRDSIRANRGFLGASRDLVSVLIVQRELVDQRLLDFFVQQQVAIDWNRTPLVEKSLGQVAVNIDALAVEAVAGEIGNVVAAVDAADAPRGGVKR